LNKSKYCTFKKFCRHHFLSQVKSGWYLVGLWNNSGKLTQFFQIAKLPTCLCYVYCAKKRMYEETNSSAIFIRTHCIPHGSKAPSEPGPPHYRGFTITDIPHKVQLLWTSDQREPENTQHSQETDTDATGGIRTRNLYKRAAADPRLRLHGHRDRL